MKKKNYKKYTAFDFLEIPMAMGNLTIIQDLKAIKERDEKKNE